MDTAITPPDYGLAAEYEHVYSGKVRDLYRAPDGKLLFVASDRISAYDWVLPTPIPDKGRVLTALSAWWFERLQGVVPNHLASGKIPKAVAGRAMLCEPLDMLPVECVVRGYLSGSAWTSYQTERSICGLGLPPGLKDSSQLPKALFTPATKAALGEHDLDAPQALIEAYRRFEAAGIKGMSDVELGVDRPFSDLPWLTLEFVAEPNLPRRGDVLDVAGVRREGDRGSRLNAKQPDWQMGKQTAHSLK